VNEAINADEDFIVRCMRDDEVGLAIEWAEREGWNPGLHDAHCFYAADPAGFFVGELRGQPVGSVSAVAYGEHFGFVGLYIVKPEFRGKGLGFRIWRHAMTYLGERNIGLDGVVTQQANYAKSGFRFAHRNIRYQGVAQGVQSRAVSDVSSVAFEELAKYDRQLFPAPRSSFLAAWIAQPDGVALAMVSEGRILGYGVLRTCRKGRKIGPLFAEDVQVAEELFNALLARCPGESVAIDVPETNPAALALAERHGMAGIFETVRMYTKEPPDVPIARMFGVTSFELG
jgi:ribosomal protein S18 acetylase RimI-like enzyme